MLYLAVVRGWSTYLINALSSWSAEIPARGSMREKHCANTAVNWFISKQKEGSMPARTGHGKKEKEGRLAFVGQLALMLAVFADRFVNGKRDQHQADQLKRAIQLARDGRLLSVAEKPRVLDEEGLQATLSLEVSQIGLRADHVKYLRERGVRYVGEFYLVEVRQHRESLDRRKEITDHLRDTLGLSEPVDVRLWWTPPYWTDEFREVLRRPIDEVVAETKPAEAFEYHGEMWYRPTRLRTLHLFGVHYVGQLLGRDYKIGSLLKTQKMLRRKSGLRAAMLLPADMALPANAPTVWTLQLAELRHQHQAESTRRAAERAQRFTKMPSALRKVGASASLLWLASVLDGEISIRSANVLTQLGTRHNISLRMFLQMREDAIIQRRVSARTNMKALREIMGELRKIDAGFKHQMTDREIDALAKRLESEGVSS